MVEMVRFSKKEKEFILKQAAMRLTTISGKGWPQTTPVAYIFDGEFLYFDVEKESLKFMNLKGNDKVSAVIDVYARNPVAVVMQGRAEPIEDDDEFERVKALLMARHPYYRANPPKKGVDMLFRITPVTKSSWGT